MCLPVIVLMLFVEQMGVGKEDRGRGGGGEQPGKSEKGIRRKARQSAAVSI